MTRPNSAMVLAAGLGTRMRPHTDELPKPLIKVAGKTLIDHALDRFEKAGINDAVVNVHYRADQIEAHLSERQNPRITISDERACLLETGGGLKKALTYFNAAPVFCTNTDAIMVDQNGKEACTTLSDAWNEKTMDALLLLAPIAQTSGYEGKGDFDRAQDGQISFRAAESAPFVFTGLQIIAPSLIEEGPKGPFSTRILWDLAAQRGRLFGAVYDGYWMHVGDPDGLEKAARFLANER